MQYKKLLNKIIIGLNILVIICLALPFRLRIFIKKLPYEISPIDRGFELISPIVYVLTVTAISILIVRSRKRLGLIIAFILAVFNVMTIFWIRAEIHWQWFWIDYWTKSGIGLIVFGLVAILILVITILKIINLKNFVQAKHKYEDIIDNDFLKLK